jgi:hypothetical protein
MKALEKEIREIEIEELKSRIEETKGILVEGNLDPETYATMVELMNKDAEKLAGMEKEMSNL